MSAETIPELDTVFIRGEGGSIFEMALPLHETIVDRLQKGHLTRVANADGDPYTEPATPDIPDAQTQLVPGLPTERPDVSALKPVWVGWAVAESARRGTPITPDQAEAATKQDLIEKYGTEPAAPIEAPADAEAAADVVGEPITEAETADQPQGVVVTADGVEHVGELPADAAEPAPEQ